MLSRTFTRFALLTSFLVSAAALQAQPATPAKSDAAVKSAAPVAPVLDAHTKEDIERHEGMARAHAQAAQCLAAGKPHEVCQKELQTTCKGLALGKHCGLRHAH